MSGADDRCRRGTRAGGQFSLELSDPAVCLKHFADCHQSAHLAIVADAVVSKTDTNMTNVSANVFAIWQCLLQEDRMPRTSARLALNVPSSS